ncbi:hypothetical protein PPYR_10990 [Photinus pyralis]|uniref:Transmembrane protein 200A n=1 Tax=Photinus pyralis TaxID=7054 RepID=A0A5N4AI07_PHOPY|nr:uncharacterized protein LOC116175103 [Photinus pyralis]KAB0796929.1 hypothetical protein PPYR_10990 [Photinus pyralis]
MQPSGFLSGGWKRAGGTSSGVVRRACPASGAQWNVQVVRGKVNGKCLWNACKALSLGLLLMVLGAAMATIGYYADHLSVAQEIRGNHTVRIKNESRGFHLNNLSYAGPIVMGVGGFIVVAACVMTFEARDSAAKVVPARFKLSSTGPPSGAPQCAYPSHANRSTHNSLRTSGSQTTNLQYTNHMHSPTDRHALTQSFMQFSRGLVVDSQTKSTSPQGSVSKSPSAPNLAVEHGNSPEETSIAVPKLIAQESVVNPKSRRTFAACALLNPSLLHRHAISVDETAATYRLSHESLHGSGSQGSMALDLHLEYPVTLKVRDRRRNPLRRQQRVDEDERQGQSDGSRRSSHSCSPRVSLRRGKGKEHHMTSLSTGNSTHHLPSHTPYICPSSRRRSSNSSDCTHRTRVKRRECLHTRGRLERAISSDSRLTGAIPKCYHHTPPTSMEQETETKSDTDIRHLPHAIPQRHY